MQTSPFAAQTHIVHLPPQGNGSATAGMVLGIISVILTILSPLFIGVCLFVSIPMAFFGLIFSMVGFSAAKQRSGYGTGQAVTGLILNFLQLLVVILPVLFVLFSGMLYVGE